MITEEFEGSTSPDIFLFPILVIVLFSDSHRKGKSFTNIEPIRPIYVI